MNPILALLATLVTDPALLASITAKINEQKFVVRTEAEEATYKENLMKNVNKDEIIKEEKKMWARRIEEDIEEASGVKKNADELHHQYAKRVIAAMQKASDDLKAKVDTYEKDGSSATTVWKTKYETLEKQSKDAITAKEAELANLKKENEVNGRRTKLSEVFDPIKAKFLTDLPGYFKEYEKNVVDDVLRNSAVIDGKLVLVDENGNPRKDQQLNNIEVGSYLTDKFKDVIKPDQQQQGGGTQPPTPGKPPVPPAGGGAPAGSKVDASKYAQTQFASQSEVTKALMKDGLLQGSKEFDELFGTIVQQKNITKIF
jgi:hypothetical protein